MGSRWTSDSFDLRRGTKRRSWWPPTPAVCRNRFGLAPDHLAAQLGHKVQHTLDSRIFSYFTYKPKEETVSQGRLEAVVYYFDGGAIPTKVLRLL